MVSKNQDDKLPAGWKVQIRGKNSRKYKCYTNKKNNKKFYSKLAVLRYIKDRSIGNEGSSTMKGNTKKSSVKKQLHAVEANDLHEWLPNGWIVELRTRKTGPKKGTMYKCFIDPATGSTFYSKPEVDRYLESSKSNAGLSQQREKGSSRHSSNNRFPDPSSPFNSCVESNVSQLSKTCVRKSNFVGKRKVVVETTIDNELPRGWIKEIRHKMIAKGVVRRDPFYMDPTGLVFRSKRDALRYIRTGEISKHAYRRKNGSINGEEFAVPPASDGKEKATETATRKQLFTDEVSPKQCISSPSEASGIKEAGSKRITRSSSRVASLDHSSVLLRPEEMSRGKSLTEKTDATGVTKGMTKVPLPKVQDDDATYRESKRITRSSLRVVGLDHSNVLLQPADSGQQMSRGKSLTEKIDATEVTKGMTKVPLRKAQDDDGEKDDATHRESKRITRSSSRVANLDHSNVLLQPANSALETSRGKSLTEKIDATEVSKGMTKVPLPKVQDDSGKKDDATHRESKRVTRSSSRVANLDHSSALLQPANSAEEMSAGNALAEKIDATEMTEGMKIIPLPKVQDDDGKKHDATHRESKPSAVSSNDMLIEEKPDTVAMKSCRKMRARTSKRKTKDRGKTPNLASRSSKRRTGVGAEVVYHPIPIEHASRATNQKPRKVQADSSLGSTPSESRDKPRTLDFIAQNGLPAPQDELLLSPNTDAQTVLDTQAGPSKLCFQPEIDLLEQYPPGFSQNPRIESSPIITDQYPPGFYQNPRIEASPIRKDQSVDPKDTFMGSKIENSPANSQLAKEYPKELRESRFENSPGVDPIQVEQPSMAETVMEHPESQFCFPSPLWSDPCLEFAYKTLTGAISLDDSLAIDDYIQHQIRTSAEQSNNNRSPPNMGVPSDETKPMSPVPRDTRIPKSNGFGSQRTSR